MAPDPHPQPWRRRPWSDRVLFSIDMELPQHTMEGLELLLTAGAPRTGGKTNAPPGLLLPGSPLLHGRRSSGCHHTKGEEPKMNLSRLTVHDPTTKTATLSLEIGLLDGV
ncbi:uncharacterized protein LOC119310663 [Triticum dicoccoides]|uniref:uncharacterized protein LOC119310663 n=1 Tax=Triticum dicoccoides TaxID=85692 RepID=UPI0018919248|nr:uncharacterized protein LOC119310663 [Triticum dicoccoides]